MRHEKRSLGNGAADAEELELANADAERPRRRRIPQSVALLPDLEDSTATPSRSSSNQQSRRSSGQPDELIYGEAIFPKMHSERQREAKPKRLTGMAATSGSEKMMWPNVFPGMGRGTCSESEEPESDRSIGRSSSFGSVGRGSSSAYDSSLGPCVSPGSSLTPRQRRRNRSRSGSSCEGGSFNDLRDHLNVHLRCPPAPPNDYQEMLGRAKGLPAAPPASPASRTASFSADPPWRDRTRQISSSSSASALLGSDMGGPLSWSTRPEKGSVTVTVSGGTHTMEFDDVHSVKLPVLGKSESAPSFSAQSRRYDPRLGTSNWRQAGMREASVDEKACNEEDDLEVVDLGPLNPAVAARNATRPITAWDGMARSRGSSDGDGRPATRGSHGDGRPGTRGSISSGDGRPSTRGSNGDGRPATRGSTRDGWQLSLCHSVAIHCPSSLPSKEAFAQRKAPRPVSPLRLGTSRTESPEMDDSNGRHDPSLHASIGERLLNMRRSSHSTSSSRSDGGDGGSHSAERAADVS